MFRASLLALPLLLASTASAARTVDYRWYSFFDAPLVQDAWAQREEVGFVKVRSFTHPVTHEATYVDGPALVPGMKASADLYAPARLAITARDLPEVTIDTIGGTRSPAATPMGFVPYDLMGNLGSPPSGGTLRLHAYMQFIDRARATALRIPQQFGYHGWENEAVVTYTMDRAAARKVLGIADADVSNIAAWFATHEKTFEQAWWWWLNDEGGDVHVGGAGRLDVRFAFNTPMQTWRVDFLSASYDAGTDSVTLQLDWVAMASDILWSRWLREALGTGFESSALSDLTVDMTVGPTSTDLDVDTVVDYALTLTGSTWVFEPTSADVPNLAVEYLNESLYQSPGLPYADKGYNGNPKVGYDYVPAAWNLRAGETLTLDFADVAPKGQMTLAFSRLEPRAGEFPGQIAEGPSAVTYTGPIDFETWSRGYQPTSWLKLADATHPQGLLPWGEPYVALRARGVTPAAMALFKKPRKPARVGKKDSERTVPPFPTATLEPTPPLTPGPGGRTLKVDLYDFLDVTMVADRWDQYDHNDYVRINSLSFPVSYQTTPYFSDEEPEPFSNLASGVRMKVTGRSLPEITIDTIGGGANRRASCRATSWAGSSPASSAARRRSPATSSTARARARASTACRTSGATTAGRTSSTRASRSTVPRRRRCSASPTRSSRPSARGTAPTSRRSRPRGDSGSTRSGNAYRRCRGSTIRSRSGRSTSGACRRTAARWCST